MVKCEDCLYGPNINPQIDARGYFKCWAVDWGRYRSPRKQRKCDSFIDMETYLKSLVASKEKRKCIDCSHFNMPAQPWIFKTVDGNYIQLPRTYGRCKIYRTGRKPQLNRKCEWFRGAGHFFFYKNP